MRNTRGVSVIAVAAMLLGSYGLSAFANDGPKVMYHEMVGNATARDRYVADAWSRLEQLEAEQEEAVQVTVTLQRSVSPEDADKIVEELGLKLHAWEAMVGKGTVHRGTVGRISDDVADVIRRLQRDVDPNLTTNDIRVVALFGTIDPSDAVRARKNEDVLSIDPTGDKRVSGKEKSRFAPHLFWTFADYYNR